MINFVRFHRYTLSVIPLLLMLISCGEMPREAESDSFQSSFDGGQLAQRAPQECQNLHNRARQAVNWMSEQCRSYMPVEVAKTTLSEVMVIIKVLGADIPPQMLVALAGATTACRVAELGRAMIDLKRASCNANSAREKSLELTRKLCTSLNVSAQAKGKAFPSWCPDKHKDGLYYCYGYESAKPNGASCYTFDKFPAIVGRVSEFTAFSKGKITFNSVPYRVRRTSVNGQSCYVMAESARCSR